MSPSTRSPPASHRCTLHLASSAHSRETYLFGVLVVGCRGGCGCHAVRLSGCPGVWLCSVVAQYGLAWSGCCLAVCFVARSSCNAADEPRMHRSKGLGWSRIRTWCITSCNAPQPPSRLSSPRLPARNAAGRSQTTSAPARAKASRPVLLGQDSPPSLCARIAVLLFVRCGLYRVSVSIGGCMSSTRMVVECRPAWALTLAICLLFANRRVQGVLDGADAGDPKAAAFGAAVREMLAKHAQDPEASDGAE